MAFFLNVRKSFDFSSAASFSSDIFLTPNKRFLHFIDFTVHCKLTAMVKKEYSKDAKSSFLRLCYWYCLLI